MQGVITFRLEGDFQAAMRALEAAGYESGEDFALHLLRRGTGLIRGITAAVEDERLLADLAAELVREGVAFTSQRMAL